MATARRERWWGGRKKGLDVLKVHVIVYVLD